MEKILEGIAKDLPAAALVAAILIILARMAMEALKGVLIELMESQRATAQSVDKLREGLEISRKLDQILREVSDHETGNPTSPRP